MPTQMVEDNDIMLERGFSATGPSPITGGFMVSIEKQRKNAAGKAQILANVQTAFPYPPKSCEDALATILSIQQEINVVNERAAAGTMKADEVDIYLEAYNDALSNFKVYVNKKKCIEEALKAEEQGYENKFQSALDAEMTSDQEEKSKTNNFIVFGMLGILLAGAIVIIFKKA